jgi:hypothetical protein
MLLCPHTCPCPVHPQALHHILAIFGFSSNIQVVEYAWAKYHHYPRLNCARVPRKKNDTGKKQILEVIDPSRKTHEIDKMGLAGFLYDKGFPDGPVSAADTGPGGSHASQPVRLAPDL